MKKQVINTLKSRLKIPELSPALKNGKIIFIRMSPRSSTRLEWAISRKNHVSAAHIPRRLNTVADEESRSDYVDIEWMLQSKFLNLALEKLCFKTKIDLFATSINLIQGDGQKSYFPNSFSLATSTNVGISPKNILTFSFHYFITLA